MFLHFYYRENKGLNVFNSAYVLADSKTATDGDYTQILGNYNALSDTEIYCYMDILILSVFIWNSYS